MATTQSGKKIGSVVGKNSRGGLDKLSTKEAAAKGDPVKPKVTAVFRNTKGEKVTLFNGGVKKGGSQKKEPVILSTTTARNNFDKKIQPIINRANQVQLGIDQLRKQEQAQKLGLAPEQQLPDEIQAEADALKSPEQKMSDELSASITRQRDDITKAYKEMAGAAQRSSRAQIRALEQHYDERKQMMEASNKANMATWGQQFQRSGQAEYSPGMTADFLTAKEREGMQRIRDIDTQYLTALDEVNLALEEKQYSTAAEKAKLLQNLEEKAQDQMRTNLKEAQEQNKILTEKQDRVRRETAIVQMLKSGVTDPLDVYTELQLDGNLGEFTFGDILEVMGKVERLNDSEKKVAKKATGGTYGDSELADGGFDMSRGFDYDKAKMADVKSEVRDMFADEFAKKLITELTDEELREFMLAYTQASNKNQQNLDPEMFLVEWAGEDTEEESSNPFS